jgi:hypothetical protein
MELAKCKEVLNTLSDCYSIKDFHYTCDLLIERGCFPDTGKLEKLERIQFFRKKKEIQKLLCEMEGVKFNPLYTLERLNTLERIATLEGEEKKTNSIIIQSNTNKESNYEANYYKRLNQLI